MKPFRIASVLVLLFLLSGCVPSLHPFYTEEDLIFESSLLGKWIEGEDTWHFEQVGEKGYSLTLTDSAGKSGEFDVYLLRVQDHLFLDLYPKEPQLEAVDLYKGLLLKVHTVLYVEQIEPELQLRALNPSWLVKYLEEQPDAVAHEKVEDGVLLTAQPKQLQAFLIRHLETPDAFGEPSAMTRAE